MEPGGSVVMRKQRLVLLEPGGIVNRAQEGRSAEGGKDGEGNTQGWEVEPKLGGQCRAG